VESTRLKRQVEQKEKADEPCFVPPAPYCWMCGHEGHRMQDIREILLAAVNMSVSEGVMLSTILKAAGIGPVLLTVPTTPDILRGICSRDTRESANLIGLAMICIDCATGMAMGHLLEAVKGMADEPRVV
jgi:hypothetical protein